MKTPSSVIFDMDGLLFDTERISLATFVEACRECHFEPDLKVYYRIIGTNSVKTRQIFFEGYGPGFPYDRIYPLWLEKYARAALTNPLPLKTGALALLNYLEQRRIQRAVVTSTKHHNALLKLGNAGVLPFFEFVLGGDEVTAGKPDPEIYLAAAGKFNLKPADCLALEDSDNGVLSATRAGMTVVQVPDLLPPAAEVKALGHLIVGSLIEVENLIIQASF